jgi:Zn-dependent protease
MAFLTLGELIDIVIMTFAIGFIFSRLFRKEQRQDEDPLSYYAKKESIFDKILYGAMIAAPAVVLHELAHKFVAISFGAAATLHAPYGMYGIAILLLLLNVPIVFLVGGYVSHTPLLPLPSAFVSLAGPLTNFLLWLIFWLLVKYKITPKKYWRELAMMGKLNLFLAGFNMLPIPGFDGFNFFQALFQTIF